MPAQRFYTTRTVYHGPGAFSSLTEAAARLGGVKPGIVTDSHLVDAGIRDRVKKTGLENPDWLETAPAEPGAESVSACVDFLKDRDLVIAIGGGSVIDTAKMASVIVTNGGKLTDYFGVKDAARRGIPLIAVPTTAGTGSEATPAAVFKSPDDGTKRGIRFDLLLPESAVLDPELTMSLPRSLTASTGVDALTHAVEAYVGKDATLMSDMAAERAIALISSNLRRAVERGDDAEARECMLMASYLAGMAICVAGVGAVHALAHTLGGIHGIAHGIANSLLLPAVMEFNRESRIDKFARVASLLGENTEGLDSETAAERAVVAVRTLTGDLGIPQSLGELGVTKENFSRIVDRCLATQGRILANNPREVSPGSAAALLDQAL